MLGWLFGKKKEPMPEFTPVVVRKEVVADTKKVAKPSKPAKMRYLCNACGYRFTRAAHIEVNVCPYCGKRDIAPDATADAQKLIESAKDTDDRFEFRR